MSITRLLNAPVILKRRAMPCCGTVFAFTFFMKIKQSIPVLIAMTAVTSFFACNQKLAPNTPKQAEVLPRNSSNVVIAQNHFAFRLFQEAISEMENDANKLVSPLSIYLDLSMAYNGAADSTKAAMRQTLGLDDVNENVLNETNQVLMNTLPHTDSAVDLAIANSIWYRNNGVEPLPDFLKTNAQYYHALVSGADFSTATVSKINQWVAENTREKIKTIIEKIDPADVMYLINAIYFKGNWATPFDPKITQQRPFTTKSGSTTEVPFMRHDGKFNFMQNDTLQMVELPYGKGDFCMYILLPAQTTSMQKFIAQLNETTLSDYLSKMDSVKIHLWMPKWKYSYEISDLKPELTTLGMGIAFSGDADFSAMYPAQTPMHISKVVHKAYIEVNEQGTEAAAATSIGVSVTSMPLNPPPVMDINRPFVYLITEKNSGAVLFLGKVNNPAEE